MNGERLYCGVSKIGDTYYLLAVPESDMAQSRNITVGRHPVRVLLRAHDRHPLRPVRHARRGDSAASTPRTYARSGPLRYNKAVGRKAIVLSFVGFLGVMLVTFYMQTLFSLSAESVSSSQRANDIAGTIQRTNEQADALTEQYDERYLSKAEAAAYIPSSATRASDEGGAAGACRRAAGAVLVRPSTARARCKRPIPRTPTSR